MLLQREENHHIVSPTMFNLAKGLLIIEILLEHALEGVGILTPALKNSYIVCLIHNMIIPAFFLISGFGFSKANLRVALRKQRDNMLIPVLQVGVAAVILGTIGWLVFYRSLAMGAVRGVQYAIGVIFGLSFDLNVDFSAMAEPVVRIGTSLGLGSLFTPGEHALAIGMGNMWFVLCLFGCWLLLNILLQHVPEKYVLPSILAISGSCLLAGHFIRLPWCLLQAGIAVSVYYLGYRFRMGKVFLRTLKWQYFLLLIPALLSGLKRFNLATCTWHFGAIEWLFSCCSAILVVWGLVRLNAWRFPGKDAVCWLGRNSLWVIAAHVINDHAFPWGAAVESLTTSWGHALFWQAVILIIRLCTTSVIFIVWQHFRTMHRKTA